MALTDFKYFYFKIRNAQYLVNHAFRNSIVLISYLHARLAIKHFAYKSVFLSRPFVLRLVIDLTESYKFLERHCIYKAKLFANIAARLKDFLRKEWPSVPV